MNIVRITSGLGNQMFQYAFFRSLYFENSETKIDISEFKYRKHHNGYELEKVFNIKPSYATAKECNALADMSKSFFSEFRRKFLRVNLKTKAELILEDDYPTQYNADFLNRTNSYFVGFWQTEKYFQDVKTVLRDEFTFKQPLDNQNKVISEQIMLSNSVSIHIRCGDYLKKRRAEVVGSVCTLDYYNAAIDVIESKVKSPAYFIFSDDIKWARENLKLDSAVYVDFNAGTYSFRDMQLMSLCKHNIIANSSFSWWGAWLNSNDQKIVVAPDIWFRNINMPDILPEDWIKIEIK